MNIRQQQQRIYDIETHLISLDETVRLLLLESLEFRRRLDIEQ